MNSINSASNKTENLSSAPFLWSGRSTFVLAICGLITILTILGNGLVLISVKLRLHSRCYSNYFIVSLCLADFFVGLFVMPLMTIHSIHLHWPFHYRLCYIWMSIDFTCSTTSCLTLASMALDRYYALTTPYFHLRNRSYSSVLICIVCSWVVPFSIWPSSILLGSLLSSDDPTCVHPAPPVVILILCIFFYYIPLLIMIVCYLKIIVNIKNIEVMIKGSCSRTRLSSNESDLERKILNNGNIRTVQSSISSHSTSSIRSLFLKYFRRNVPKDSMTNITFTDNDHRHITPINRHIKNGSMNNYCRTSNNHIYNLFNHTNRQVTTATFTGRRIILKDINDDNQIKPKNIFHQNNHLNRTNKNSRRSSLTAIRSKTGYCIKYQLKSQGKYPDEQNHVKVNSTGNVQSRSQSYSSSQGIVNGGIPITDASDHALSYENNHNDEHRRLNRHKLCSQASLSYDKSRYSQHAVARFMHERNKARLRRNQKASRMLGILLSVFLICWLPFAISYPIMTFHPELISSQLQSIIFWLGYVNSLLNPFLYVYSSRNFRQATISTLCYCIQPKTKQHLRYQ